MQNIWSHGYYVSSAYTGGFYAEQTPISMAWAALAAGTRPPGHEGRFTYLELGCGFGETALAVATAHPDCHVIAIDLNPEHVVALRDRAAELGLDNIEVHDKAFSELSALDVQADFVALHGVISWVDDSVRRDIVELLARTTNAGGLVYVSYNAMPGRAAAVALQRMIVERLEHETGTPLQRLEKALAWVDRAAKVSHFFKGHQNVVNYLAQTRKRPMAYLAHEFINSAWDPLFFRQVEDLFREARLNFVGGADVVRSVASLAVPKSMRPLLESISDRSHRESTRDMLMDTGFRRDLFGRGKRRLAPGAQRRTVLATRFCLAKDRAECTLDVRVPAGEIRLHEDPYNALLDALVDGPRTGGSMIGTAHDDAEQVFIGLLVLTAVGHILPALSAEDDPERTARIRLVNRVSLGLIDEQTIRLISPVTGLAHRLNRFEALIARGIWDGVDDVPRWAAHAMAEAGQELIMDDMPVVDPEEVVPEFTRLAEVFRTKRLPELRRAGIMA